MSGGTPRRDALLARLALDVDAAYEAFVAEHARLVYGIAWRTLGDAAEAEDAAQETFVRAYRALREYEPGRIRELQPRAWLARIALNCARNRRRGAPGRTLPLDDAAERPDDVETRPHEIVERRESSRHLAALLASLPATYRQAVELRHVHGLSYAEIADALERPLGTVKVHVHRGVRLLREAHERALEHEQRDRPRPADDSPVRPTLRLVSEVSR